MLRTAASRPSRRVQCPPMLFRRRLLGALSVLSLVLGGIIVVLWVRSYRSSDMIYKSNGEIDTGVVTARGLIMFWRWERPQNPPYSPSRWKYLAENPAEDFAGYLSVRGVTMHAGFGYGSGTSAIPEHDLVLPMWLVAVVLLVCGLSWGRRFNHYAHPPGLCPACGYDTRATPGRCSECGWREAGENAK